MTTITIAEITIPRRKTVIIITIIITTFQNCLLREQMFRVFTKGI